MNKKITLLFLATIFMAGAFAQYKTLKIDTSFNEFSSYNKYQKDFYCLTKFIENSHPDVYNSISEYNYKKKVDSLHNALSDNSQITNRVVLSEYSAILNDGHTSVYPKYQSSNTGTFPIRFYINKNNVRIANVLENYPNQNIIDKKVISINNIPIETLYNRFEKYIGGNIIYKRKIFGRNLFYHSVLSKLGITEKTLIVESEKNNLTSIDTFLFESSNYKTKVKFSKDFSKDFDNDLFSYNIIDDSVCYFKMNECRDLQELKANRSNYPFVFRPLFRLAYKIRGGNFRKFLNKMFNEMYEKNIKNLVVDLSNNSGGTSILSDQFLYHILDNNNISGYSERIKLSPIIKIEHPDYYNDIVREYAVDTAKIPILLPAKNSNKNYFNYLSDKKSPYYMKEPSRKYDGKIYLIIGQKTASSATMLAVMLKDNNLTNLIVGEPMGMRPTHFGEVMSWTLPLTGTRVNTSTKYFVRPDSLNKETVFNPDVTISKDIDDRIEGRNPALEYILNVIKGGGSLSIKE